MKIFALPLFFFFASILLVGNAWPAHAAQKAKMSGTLWANNCQTQAREFYKAHADNANIADARKAADLNKQIYYSPINGQPRVPVFSLGDHGPLKATLVVLIHNTAISPAENPDLYAICHDQNHEFGFNNDDHSIDFRGDDNEQLFLLFRLDPSLPTTRWKAPPASVEMVGFKKTAANIYPNPLPKPMLTDWCIPASDKHVHVQGKDMFFRMCKHNGDTLYYKYSLHFLDVNGKESVVDPIIVHRPQ